MSILDKVENLLGAIKKSDRTENEKDETFDIVENCITAYTEYHNEAVNQGHLVTVGKYRLDDDDFMNLISNLHERRKSLHEDMVNKTMILNDICRQYGEAEIYRGPLDIVKGRNDEDTRFGVAEFAEELCRDFYRTTYEIPVPDQAKEAFREHAANIRQKEGKWGIMEKMMEKANAQRNMDANEFADAISKLSSDRGQNL